MIHYFCAEPIAQNRFVTVPPSVSIVTVNYNQAEMTAALLRSIREFAPGSATVVVDNGSSEDPSSLLSVSGAAYRLVKSAHNLGFAGGNNLALPWCEGDFLFFINNDAEITEGCMEALVRRFHENPSLGIVSPLICYFQENTGTQQDIIQYAGSTRVHPLTARNRTIGEKQIDRGQFKGHLPTAYAHGAAMMIRREVLERVGPMEASFFLYYEELDWCERIRRAGYEIEICADAKVYHKESMTVGPESPLKTYYLNRNRLYFMRRNRNAWQWSVFVLFLACFTIPKRSLLYLLTGQTAHLKAFYRALAWNFLPQRPSRQTGTKPAESITHQLVL